ncbi:MAG TPA: choice-of-anchor tandem repeat GloVer-containing protein, partial [Candidatus Sulfotelmatobacter sp.]
MKCVSTLLPMIAFAVVMTTTSATAQTYTRLFTYPGTTNNTSGITWPGLISQGPDGQLYSTDVSDGTHNNGSVYKLTTGGLYTPLLSFCSQTSCADGSNPYGGVTLGNDGDLYGTTYVGGLYDSGTIFKMTDTGTWTKLWDFTEGLTAKHLKDEGLPYYPPILGQDGNYYGVDHGVYSTDYGIFYKMTPKGALTAFPFTFTDGAFPNLPTQGTDFNFYGTARLGGDPTCKCGVVYKATTGGKIAVLHNFKGYPSDGSLPTGVLVQGNDGNFYGTTYQGGAHNYGCVFKITPAGVITIIYSFESFVGDGVYPEAGLILGTDGNLYGVTAEGGKFGYGTIFEMTTAGKETILYNSCSVVGCTDGIYPATPLVQHSDGRFFGNTNGNSLGGSVFYSLDLGLAPFARLVLWSGTVGSTVEILGQGFTGTTKVSFHGASASFKVVSDTYLTATVPAGAATGTVTV